VGVVAVGNFSLTAAMAQAAALLVAPRLPSWEIIDYASATKADAPSGTARELAERLATVATPHAEVPVERTAGAVEARGTGPDERMVIRHDAGATAAPYLAGTLLAVRR
jgi:4-hydroxy-tetrahydrodipicolinate reductase